jgi:hypothetical protein
MRGKASRCLAALAAIAIVAGIAARGAADTETTLEERLKSRARSLLERLDEGQYEAAVEPFDDAMRKAMPADKLKATYESLGASLGKRLGVDEARVAEGGGYTGVIWRVRFERASIDARVVFDKEGKVAGLFFTPYAPPTAGLPAYADAARFAETPLEVGGVGLPRLPGTLATPEGDGPFPAVVLVHGSGPQDRDETVGGVKVFRDLAAGLASRGVAALRYEKRTKAYPQSFGPLSTVEEETIIDALAAAALLRGTARIDPKRVLIVGHSLGATLAPEILRRDPAVAGAVLLAGTARPWQDVVLAQGERALLEDGAIDPAEIVQLKEGRRIARALARLELAPEAQGLLGTAAYIYAFNALDPVPRAKTLGRPLLIIQGGRDFQVSPVHDYLRFVEALDGTPGVAFRLYPALNHILVAGEGRGGAAEYEKAANVDAKLVADVAAWIATGKLPPE